MNRISGKHYSVFIGLWVVLFIIYLPTAESGFVADFTGWLQQIRTDSFWDYMNRSHFVVHSMYQFTQLTTYIFYQLFGANAWLWHLLHITMQALNAYLWYLLCLRILKESDVKYSKEIALTGVLLFCISPYLSEVVVWEPAFHYLLSFLLMQITLLCVQKYFSTAKIKYAWLSAIVFFLSTYSLEVFYITPVLVFILALYYRIGLKHDKTLFRKSIVLFVLPQLLLFLAHLLVYHFAYGGWLPHLKDITLQHSWRYYYSKPGKYIFQVAFLGKYFSIGLRDKVYTFFESPAGIFIIIGILVATLGLILLRFKKLGASGKTISLFFTWLVPILIIMGPLWFSTLQRYVYCDRYLYMLSAFVYMLICIVVGSLFKRAVFLFLIAVYALTNLYCTYKTNKYWNESTVVIHSMLYNIPDANGRTVLILNTPENLQGVPMMDAIPEGEYKLMHNELVTKKINEPIYDVAAFNMVTKDDGATAIMINDTTVGVTLNQWGTWWWYRGLGSISYENEEYKLQMKDPGHYYELVLKHPLSHYLLLYLDKQTLHELPTAIKH